MAANDRPPGSSKPRVNYLRRRPRPGALVRPADDLALPHERDQSEQDMTDGRVPPEGRQAHGDLQRGVQDLSSDQWELFRLRHLENRSIEEIAQQLAKSEDAVKSHLYRARKVLLAR